MQIFRLWRALDDSILKIYACGADLYDTTQPNKDMVKFLSTVITRDNAW